MRSRGAKGCPNFAAAEAEKTRRKGQPAPARAAGQRGPTPGQKQAQYYIPSVAAPERYKVCRSVWLNANALGKQGVLLGALLMHC